MTGKSEQPIVKKYLKIISSWNIQHRQVTKRSFFHLIENYENFFLLLMSNKGDVKDWFIQILFTNSLTCHQRSLLSRNEVFWGLEFFFSPKNWNQNLKSLSIYDWEERWEFFSSFLSLKAKVRKKSEGPDDSRNKMVPFKKIGTGKNASHWNLFSVGPILFSA
jgi:hypothetical protein